MVTHKRLNSSKRSSLSHKSDWVTFEKFFYFVQWKLFLGQCWYRFWRKWQIARKFHNFSPKNIKVIYKFLENISSKCNQEDWLRSSRQNVSRQNISRQNISRQNISRQNISRQNISRQNISRQKIPRIHLFGWTQTINLRTIRGLSYYFASKAGAYLSEAPFRSSTLG